MKIEMAKNPSKLKEEIERLWKEIHGEDTLHKLANCPKPFKISKTLGPVKRERIIIGMIGI